MRELFRLLERGVEKENAGNPDMKIGISKGFSVAVKGTEYKEVVRRADEAMYADKAEYYRSHDRRRH